MTTETEPRKAPAQGPIAANPASTPSAASPPSAAPAPSAASAPSAFSRLWRRVSTRPDPLTGVALTLPVFLAYHLGILVIPDRSDADAVSRLAFKMLDASVPAYITATFAIALVVAVIVWVQQKRGATPVWSIGRVVLESGAYALLLLVTLGWATYRLAPGIAAASPTSPPVLTKLVLACGAGFHEELVFHALLVTGAAAALQSLLKLPRPTALGTTVLVSSLLFALAQYLGSYSDVTFDTFFYRALLGLAFALLYLVRGFAVAVYSHVFYVALVYFVYA